jgi:diphthamide synthase (EF-2-diphthine--ammonia ligase)
MKTLVSWSSGKDSAWMVHTLRQRGDVEIGALLTTINESAQRVAMHAVRVDVLQAQADALGFPLWMVPIPSPCPNEVYEEKMR